MRMYKMLGLAVAIAAASTFALTGCGGKEAKTLVRVFPHSDLKPTQTTLVS